MDYIRDFINPFVKIKTFGDGLVMTKTKLRLGLASLSPAQRTDQDIDQVKKEATQVSGNDKFGAINASDFEDKIGDQYVIRKATDCVTLGTIYGKAQRFVLDLVQHSVSGLNVNCITTDGLPSVSAILKRLREIAVNTDIKEQRNSRFFNSVMTNGFYDNATSLIVVIQLRIALLGMFVRNKRHKRNIYINVNTAEQIVNINDDSQALKALVDAIKSGRAGVGTSVNDRYLYVVLENLRMWTRSLPDKYVMSPAGVQVPNPDYVHAKFQFEAEVWKMYEYNDGHSTSGNSFGNHLDFVNNAYLIPQWLFTVETAHLLSLAHLDHEVPKTDLAIDQLGKKTGYLNLAGFSNDEVAALAWCLKGNTRSTPFLIDQTIHFGLEDNEIVAYHARSPIEKTYNITERLLQSMLNKFVNNHRVYEDALSASRALRYWLVQPGTETVESHWWTTLDRELHLPKLGLKRASLPMLLESDGVSVTADALSHYKDMAKDNDGKLIESLFANTCWYWGEYLLLFNAKNCSELIKRLHYTQTPDITPFHRADAIFSAMIGRAIPKPLTRDVSTLITGGTESQIKNRVKFGTIQIQHIEEYKYEVENQDIIFDNIVVPGGLALVTGLGGSLIRSTPYASHFTTNNSVVKQEYGVTRKALNYNDLWALGVISRWNGYDLNYIHPARSGRHTIYAANDVSVAVPPVAPLNLPYPKSYVVTSYDMRARVFGFTPETLHQYSVTAYWSRQQTNVQQGPDYKELPCGHHDINPGMVRMLKLEQHKFENYVAAVVGEYDINQSDFRLDLIEAGVPMPNNIQLLSYESPQQMEEVAGLEPPDPVT
uniref:Capsid protein n=1 Tax=Uromyces fabae virus TaxID=3069272 RepID=A0AA51UCT7_9VIRU|nr:putative capsid protein [Uromyces fabae virus]